METNRYKFEAQGKFAEDNQLYEIQISEDNKRARYRITMYVNDHVEYVRGRWQHIRTGKRTGRFIMLPGAYRLYLERFSYVVS